MTAVPVSMTVNGESVEREVEPCIALADFLRGPLELTGTHLGCEHGVCGSCTILLDGVPVRSCLMLAVQAEGCTLTTVEGLGSPENLHPLQHGFAEAHGLQCGFCTPGLLMTAYALLQENPTPTREEVREAIAGNLCRCTGYNGIVEGIMLAVRS
jgi:carbon-monoxide dehydrogenase small subunit